jgi:hypothetical protein
VCIVLTTAKRRDTGRHICSYIYERHIGTHVVTAELQVGFMPRYINGDHIEVIYHK